MKKMTFLLLFTLFYFYSNAQSCGMDEASSESRNQGRNSISGIKFFSEKACDPLIVKCNFVFLTRDDGTGAFDPNSPFITNLISRATNDWALVKDPADCSPGFSYPYDANIRLQIGVHQIADTDAWDYYAQASNLLPFNESSFYPSSLDQTNNDWPTLMDQVNQFTNANSDAINYFFVEKGAELGYYEDALINNPNTNQAWVDLNNISIFSGASRLPSTYDSGRNQFIIMAGAYTEYFRRLHFGHLIYDPTVPNETHAQYWFNDMVDIVNHELGHTILNQFHTCGCNNLMIGGGCNPSYIPYREYLSPQQLEELHRTIATTNVHDYIDCDAGGLGCDYVAQGNGTNNSAQIGQPMSVFGDLVVKTGTTLTITSKVYFSPQSKIIVEENARLIVDGGTLTNGCGDTWEGIRVTGKGELNASDFDVQIINGSTIENTSGPAVSMMPNLPWPERNAFGNGSLLAEDSEFINTSRMVEFIAFQPSFNNSSIKNCIQKGGKWGISNWNCINVEVIGNIFQDIELNSIVTETGQFHIEGNEFNSGQADILFANVSPGLGTDMIANTFKGQNTGVRAIGTTFAQNRMLGNEFLAEEFDVFMDGDNNYLVQGNISTANFGAIGINNGNHSNEVAANQFIGNVVGLLPSGSNGDYTFYGNCFTTTFADAFIVGDISQFVSNGTGAANNCFTHQGLGGMTDLGGNPNPFTYVEPNDVKTNCFDVFSGNPNITIINIGNPGDFCTTEPPSLAPISPCHPKKTIEATTEARNWLLNQQEDIQNDPSLSPEQQTFYLSVNSRCLKRVTGMLFDLKLQEGDYTGARALYNTDQENDGKVAMYTSYVYENDLPAAQNYLTGLITNNEALQDFKTVQLINLNRIQQYSVFEPTSEDLSTVYAIANKEHPYAGYAKALHYALTEEVLVSDLPDMEADPSPLEMQIGASSEVIAPASVFPNPFSAHLNIVLNSSNEAKLRIVDSFGRLVYEGTINESKELSTKDWHNGLYIVELKTDKGLILQKKLMLIK